MDKLTAIWLAEALGYGAENATEAIHCFVEEGMAPPTLAPRQAARWNSTKPSEYEPILERCTDMGIAVIPFTDERYPERLRQIPSAPPVLYCQGDVSLLKHPMAIGMVGTRRPSQYGADAASHIGRGLAKGGALIISGLAAGLDSAAHKAALAEDKPTLACIGFGHSFCYPSANRALMEVIARNGLVVSEYPPDVGPEKPYFLHRNRLIAALSHGVLVTEARARSGTMSTVNFANEFGRDVFAVPGSIFSSLSTGTNALVREGAYLAASAADVLGVYGYEQQQERKEYGGDAVLDNGGGDMAPSPEAQALLAVLTTEPKAIEAISGAAGVSPGQAIAALAELELCGLATQHAGRRFTIQT